MIQILLLFIVIFFGIIFIKKFGLFNPIFLFFLFDIIIKIAFPIFFYLLNIGVSFSDDIIDKITYLCFMYVISYYFGTTIYINRIEILFLRFINNSSSILNKFALRKLLYFSFIISISCYLILLNNNILWLTEPRSAYGSGREGLGIIWSPLATFTSIGIIVISILSFRKDTKFSFLYFLFIIILIVLSYFTGSKQTILSGFISILFIYNFYYRKISIFKSFIIFILLFSIFILLTIIQGSFNNYIDALSYFDYFSNTIKVIEIGHNPLISFVIFSELNSYIPRFIWDEKPIIYGIGLISDYLFPGSSDLGYFPGYLSWTSYYLDFSYFGVIFFGLVSGFNKRFIYNIFIANKNNLFLLLLFINESIGIFNTPAILLFNIFILLLCISFRYKLKV